MKMYKKFKLELTGTTINYLADKVSVNASFKMLDPNQIVGADESPEMRNYGQYNTQLEFPLGSEPTKQEICDEVNAQDGVVSTY